MSTRLSISGISFLITSSLSEKVVMVNLWIPLMAEGETDSVSMLSCLRVKMVVIWLSTPTVFSEKTVMVYNVLFSLILLFYKSNSKNLFLISLLLLAGHCSLTAYTHFPAGYW